MDREDVAKPAALMTVTGPAVFGHDHDPAQILCWKPCCNDPVRLNPDEFELWLPLVVACDLARCQSLWTVQFPRVPAGEERMAVWWLCRRNPVKRGR